VRDGSGGLDDSGGFWRIQFVCLFSSRGLFSLRQWSRRVFQAGVAVRHWFFSQGLQGEAVVPMYTRFACLLVIEFLLMLEFGYLRDEISRSGVMSRVCSDMEKSKFKERVRIGGPGRQKLRSSSQ
jgi:hypothetical protein